MANGGFRPGSGRKPNAQKFAGIIEKAKKRIGDRLPEVIDKMFELAEGVTVQEIDPKTGDARIYTTPPDYRAVSYLIDRIMGKPTQPVAGDNDAPAVRIEVVYADAISESNTP